jgi:hypothetical protein
MKNNEIRRVLDNPMTPQLVGFVDKTKSMSEMLLSPQFFHKSHSKRDREVLVELLLNYYPGSEIERLGEDGVLMKF